MPMNILAADEPAFKDMTGSEYYAESAGILSELGILAGYEDGTYGAEKTITRAEMSAIVCRILGKEADAEKAKGKTEFDDVAADHWASGYINIATKEGIINGDGNGKFRPEDDVKYEEAIKMLVCALGYAENITVDPKDWSKAYLDIAEEKGFTENLKGKKGEAATRGDIAVMSLNGMESDLVAPIASLKEGSYRGTQKVKLSTTTKDADIYYTTNGDTPTVKSTKYTKEISITRTSTLKAITVKNGVIASDIMSVKYTIKSSGGGGGSSSPSTPSSYTVSFDLNYEGATDAPANQTVNSGATATKPENPTRENYAFVGWYEDSLYTSKYDFSQVVSSNITLYARWVDIADTTDTDGDGLTDPMEEYYGTDKTKVDTDEDGLSDCTELMSLGLNPLIKDTDNNGIEDGNEDSDLDLLTNLDEITRGTDPALADSDSDDLNDYTEINTYGTNPIMDDTDEDGVSDGKEIELGTDPLVAQSSFDLNVVSETNDTVSASVQLELDGEQVETLSVEPVENDALFSDEIPGYLGQAYDFNVEGTFDSATLNFEFDDALLNDPDFDPVIYYYNETTGLLEELSTTISGNVASAEVTHFSTYILINRKVYQESFTWQDTWENEQHYTDVELILIIDDSGSMDGNDSNNQRLAVAQTLVDNLPEGSKIGIVKFASSTSILTSSLTDSKDDAKTFLTTSYFSSYGGTKMYRAINDSFGLFESTETTTLKMMVVLTDGDTSDTSSHSSVVSTANSNNVRIYTVGLGNSTSYFNSYLKPLANNTGAAFYLASDADELSEIYNDISEKIDIETDTDNDGIPDYYEDNMVLFNGVKIQLDKNNPDTDGDGKLDGEEVELTYTYNNDRSQVVVKGKVNADPLNKDTDYDGIIDSEDNKPLVWNISDRDLAMFAQICYEDIPEGTLISSLSTTYPNYAKNINDKFQSAASLEELKGWKVFKTHYSIGGLQIAVFEKDKQLVFACRGSEDLDIWYKSPEFFADWIVADGLGWLTGINAQAPAAKSFVKKTMKNYSSYSVYVTGHSLGGNVAYNLASKALDVDNSRVKKINTYNGLGLLYGVTLGITDWVDAYRLADNGEKIKNYHVDGDVVFGWPLTFHYGSSPSYSMSEGAYGAHDLYSFFVQLPHSRSDHFAGGGGGGGGGGR